MSTFPVILNLNDTSPPPKPDTFAVEYQLGNIRIDPNTGNVMGDSSGCYRTPHVGGVVVLTEDYQLSDVDSGWTFVCNSATPFTLTLQGAVPILPNPEGLWNIKIRNLGAGAVTLDPNGLNLDGSASTVTINQGDAYVISTDGTDYYSGVVATAAGSSTLAADTDVSISSPADRDLLIYHSSDSKWHDDTLVAADIPNIAESKVTGLVSDLATLAAGIAGAISNVVIGFVINNGAAGTNVGPELLSPRAGSVTKCVIVTKTSDGTTGLTFRIKKNGTDVFTSDPSVAAGTSAGTVSSSTSLTSNPLSVSLSDVFTIDITSGSPNWAFTAQLET